RRPPRSTLFPYTTSSDLGVHACPVTVFHIALDGLLDRRGIQVRREALHIQPEPRGPLQNGLAGKPAMVSEQEIVHLPELALLMRSEEHTSELQSLAYLVC